MLKLSISNKNIIMSGIIWNIWTYCNRLITYTVSNTSSETKKTMNTICVNPSTLQQTFFYFGENINYPIYTYCHYCGCKRFTENQIKILSNSKTKYCDIDNNPELKYITKKNINPIICTENNCLLGLYNLSSTTVAEYDITEIMNHSKYTNNSCIGEILNV